MARVAVTGASGLIGSQLATLLAERRSTVLRLVRRAAHGAGEVAWNPVAGTIDAGALEKVDAVVHLAGEGVASGRWSAGRKRKILESRTRGTELVARTLAGLRSPPRVLLVASAVGYYGDSGAQPVDEDSALGQGFLAEVTDAWERAADVARAADIRVVHARIGVVLARNGGMLQRLMLPFRLGLGGAVGDGRQYMSWIALEDCVAALDHLLRATDLAGPVNLVAPGPVTNAEFTRELARALHRPALLPLPAPLVRLGFGQMGRELLLAGQNVSSARLEASGFAFRHRGLAAALAALLG